MNRYSFSIFILVYAVLGNGAVITKFMGFGYNPRIAIDTKSAVHVAWLGVDSTCYAPRIKINTDPVDTLCKNRHGFGQ
jgi:hypothetical protein